MENYTITINNKTCIITSEPNINIDTALNSSNFIDWKNSLDINFRIHKIHFQSCDMFGKRVGFLKWITDVEFDGVKIPGIVLARGGSVAILVVLTINDLELNEPNDEYTILVVQPRLGTGVSNLTEIPAGMLDGEGDFGGIAAKELSEEADIKIRKDDLIDMTEMVHGTKHKGIYSSCGLMDEYIKIFLYKTSISKKELEEINGKCTGEIDSGEVIKLKVCKLKDIIFETADSKALCSLLLYKHLYNC